VNGESIIQALNDSNIVFIPFVLDPYGGLAPFAHQLLDGTKLPDSLQFTSPTSQTAYNNAASASAPTALLAHADKERDLRLGTGLLPAYRACAGWGHH